MGKKEIWDSYNELLMKGKLDRFTKMFARYELFKRVVDLPGHIIECGVLKGAGVLYWAKLIQIFNPLSIRKVIGFDTFRGYPETTKYDYDKKAGEKFLKDSEYDGVSPRQIMKIAESLGLDHRIELIKGDATKTIKKYVESNPGLRVSLLNLDFDIYDPTIEALNHLYPRVVPNGVIIFDEYASLKWGESDAVDDFFKDKEVVYTSFPWALSPTAFLVKNASISKK